MRTFIIALLIPMFLLSAPRDIQVNRLHQWFIKYDSPLVGYEQDFVDMAKEFGLNYRLLPAIATQESQCGKIMPDNSYNVFGYNNGDWKFRNFKHAIWAVGLQITYGKPYYGKSLDEKLKIYNPNYGYSERIKRIMENMCEN